MFATGIYKKKVCFASEGIANVPEKIACVKAADVHDAFSEDKNRLTLNRKQSFGWNSDGLRRSKEPVKKNRQGNKGPFSGEEEGNL